MPFYKKIEFSCLILYKLHFQITFSGSTTSRNKSRNRNMASKLTEEKFRGVFLNPIIYPVIFSFLDTENFKMWIQQPPFGLFALSLACFLADNGAPIRFNLFSNVLIKWVKCHPAYPFCLHDLKGHGLDCKGCSPKNRCSMSRTQVSKDMNRNSMPYFAKIMARLLKEAIKAKHARILPPFLKVNGLVRFALVSPGIDLGEAFRYYLSVVPPPYMWTGDNDRGIGYLHKEGVDPVRLKNHWKTFSGMRKQIEKQITKYANENMAEYINHYLQGDFLLVFLLRVWFLLPKEQRENIELIDGEMVYTFRMGLGFKSGQKKFANHDDFIKALVIACNSISYVQMPQHGKLPLAEFFKILTQYRPNLLFMPACLTRQEKNLLSKNHKGIPLGVTARPLANIEVVLKDGSKLSTQKSPTRKILENTLPGVMINIGFFQKLEGHHLGFYGLRRTIPKSPKPPKHKKNPNQG